MPTDPAVAVLSTEPVPGRRPTISDVAALAGTPTGTVAFLLDDRPGVAAKTRERVHAAMAELGRQPRALARPADEQLTVIVHRGRRVGSANVGPAELVVRGSTAAAL